MTGEPVMSLPKICALLLLPVVAACTTLSDKDRALLDAASRDAAQALEVARTAQASADAARSSAAAAQSAAEDAARSAAKSAADAAAANEKADRMLRKAMRK